MNWGGERLERGCAIPRAARPALAAPACCRRSCLRRNDGRGMRNPRTNSCPKSIHPKKAHSPKKNSSLPPFRGEVRWGVGRCELRTKLRLQRRPPTAVPAPPPFRHSCAGRNSGLGPDRRLDRWWTIGASHPHLTSPLKGGRDELGRGATGKGMHESRDLRELRTELRSQRRPASVVPACAGMTEGECATRALTATQRAPT